MKTKNKQLKLNKQNLMMRKAGLYLTMIIMVLITLPSVSYGGQNWTLSITNNNSAAAYYQGYINEACWYPMDFSNAFTIGKNSTAVKNTEEKWAVFEDCGGGDSYITLNFLVFGSNGYAAAITVTLVDTYEHAPPASNPINCTSNGYGQNTAVGWAWVNGAPPGASDPIITCGKSGDSSTTNVQLTLPTF
ncbi:MAG: hypothetical protein ABJF11_14125 [Reichenbachiella sp.]|uniref:hypothetical protein n=1 Tax=Reichenbachiella sp. TaxID=2184521 RepID=UPI0032637AED